MTKCRWNADGPARSLRFPAARMRQRGYLDSRQKLKMQASVVNPSSSFRTNDTVAVGMRKIDFSHFNQMSSASCCPASPTDEHAVPIAAALNLPCGLHSDSALLCFRFV